MAQGDLERPDLEELQWSTEQRSASLSRVFEHAVRLAANAERWYAQKRRPKRQWGRVLRVGAIVLGAVAAVLPILAEISADDGRPSIAPGWAAVALACAAALVALDRYLGFSTAWMRFMKAEMQITRLRHGFEYAWQDALVKAATPPSDDEATKLLALAREFALAVDDAMADEIAAWISEFTTSLERADGSRARPIASHDRGGPGPRGADRPPDTLVRPRGGDPADRRSSRRRGHGDRRSRRRRGV